jgi:3-hydroxybutyryl-CoA dehydrogenase
LLGRKSGRGFYDYQTGALPAPATDVVVHQTIVHRILVMLINEAADAVFQNIAAQQDIDLAMRHGVNYPKGLLAWANALGLDNVLGELEKLHTFYGDDRYRPCPLLKQMVAKGEVFAVAD